MLATPELYALRSQTVVVGQVVLVIELRLQQLPALHLRSDSRHRNQHRRAAEGIQIARRTGSGQP